MSDLAKLEKIKILFFELIDHYEMPGTPILRPDNKSSTEVDKERHFKPPLQVLTSQIKIGVEHVAHKNRD